VLEQLHDLQLAVLKPLVLEHLKSQNQMLHHQIKK
jgi:hypothetical protein